MSTPALLKRCAVHKSWVGLLDFPRFGVFGCCCLLAGMTESSRAAKVASGLPSLSVAVGVMAGVLAAGESLGFEVSIFEAVTVVQLCVAKGPAPSKLFDVTTVGACFSSAIAAHLPTLLIAMTAAGSSSSRDAAGNPLRLRLLELTVAFSFFRFRQPLILLLA